MVNDNGQELTSANSVDWKTNPFSKINLEKIYSRKFLLEEPVKKSGGENKQRLTLSKLQNLKIN